MTEPFVRHIVFYLSKDGFGLDASSLPMLKTFFGGQSLPGLTAVFRQTVVDFDDSIALGLMAASPQRTSLTTLCFVPDAFGLIPAFGM